MIITKFLRLKLTDRYRKIGYVASIDGFYDLKIEDLSLSSKKYILVKCDFCGKEKEVTYKYYNMNTSNQENLFSCSSKCGSIKAKKTNLEKFGTENVFQNDSIKEKIKQTNLEKYGVENYSKTDEYKEKVKQTNLKKFGTESAIQNSEVKEKVKQTNLERYGCEYASQATNFKEKVKQTNLERYGCEYGLQNIEIKEKSKQTKIKKYDVEYSSQIDGFIEKVKQTNLKKYGVEYATQNQNIKDKSKKTNLKKYDVDNYKKSEISKLNTIIGQHPNYIKYTENKRSLFKCDSDKDHEFEIHSDNFHDRLSYNLPLCTICYPIGDQKSIKEKILLEYIKSIYNGEIISGYRDSIEIDIYLPELKLGIEFNGLYWHSNKFRESNYHVDKLNWFKSKNIDIKYIYEDDFDNNLDIIKSQISNWIGKTKTKIYGRKCQIKEVNTNEYRDFLNQNHIQGYVPVKLVYGLYYDNTLVSLMCFDKKEGRLNMSENEWNLSRFCNLLNHQIIGGASKLLNHFIKINNPYRIISYADKDWSSGNLYFKLGFKLINESKPDYKYIVNGVRINKQNFNKSKLGKMGYDILNLTESQIMENLNINKIYDCGKMKFEKSIE